jgi:MoaA/NifB/PqqE/SkfB family radical SAM enzyme
MNNGKNAYHEKKLLHPYHMERVTSILNGNIPVPSNIEIDLTDEGCNQACLHCCFGSSSSKKVRRINQNELMKFLEDAFSCGSRAFELVGGGEPTNHPEIADIIERIASFGESGDRACIGLVTNGVLLDRVFPSIENLQWIRISLDAADERIYNQIHGIPSGLGHFSRVVKNIKMSVQLAKHDVIRVGYLVIPPYNHQKENIFRAAELAHELKVKHIAFRPVFLDRDIDVDLWQEASDAINECKMIYGEEFVIGGSDGSWNYVLGNKAQPKGVCRTRPLVLVVKADGSIPSCFLFREKKDQRPFLGHISEGFKEVWFSEKHYQSIKSVNRETCPKVCKSFRADNTLDELENEIKLYGSLDSARNDDIDNPFFI